MQGARQVNGPETPWSKVILVTVIVTAHIPSLSVQMYKYMTGFYLCNRFKEREMMVLGLKNVRNTNISWERNSVMFEVLGQQHVLGVRFVCVWVTMLCCFTVPKISNKDICYHRLSLESQPFFKILQSSVCVCT